MKTLTIILTTLLIAPLINAKVIQSKVNFIAKGKPSFIKIEGTTKLNSGDLTLEANKLQGKFVVDLTSITTGVDLRDDHLKNKYLEVGLDKFKNATLTFLTPFDSTKKKHTITAMLNLHGEDKEVELDAELTKMKDVMSVMVKFPISIHHYNIDVPSFKGITVAKKVDITVEAKVSIKTEASNTIKAAIK